MKVYFWLVASPQKVSRILKPTLLWAGLIGLVLVGCAPPADLATLTPVTTPIPPSPTFEPSPTLEPSETPLPTATPQPTAANPVVTISPVSGPPGTVIQVAAQGFPPNASVDIGVGRVDSEYDVVATASTDDQGNLDIEITLPNFVEPDDRWVIVVAAQDQRVKAISAEFDVTQGQFTSANIYLIAVGDDGQSGQRVGCGDSVVPVEVNFEPTVAPLTAALEELLALEAREYGQSDLYNALYQSDLTIESIDIEAGEAILRLAGTYQIGGVCDEPRVQAQLEETALQFSTVQEVSVFINGEPLD